MVDIIIDLENSMYFVRENERDIAVFTTLEQAQEYSSELRKIEQELANSLSEKDASDSKI